MQASGRRWHPGRRHRGSADVRVDRFSGSRPDLPPKAAVPPRPRHSRIPAGAEGQADGRVLRPCVLSGLAIIGASVIAVTPIAPPPPPDIHTASPAVRLTADSSSIANIPTNLFYALANVPYNEVRALDELSRSLLFTGNWFVGSSTNIWGTDPADPGHWKSVVDLLVPFPALSGPAGDQLAMWWAAQYVVDAACDAVTCAPLVPLQPITGITALDKTIWAAVILAGGHPFPLLDNMFKVSPLELLSGYTFGNVVDNSGPVNSYFGFEGTHPGPNGEPLMPWSGTTFTLNPLAGWENFFRSLMAPPPSLADGIHIASGLDLGQALAAVLAGLVVDFNPFEPGSPFCPGQCALPANLTTEGIVRTILASSPGNPVITEWLDRVADGTANGPTQAQRDFLIQEFALDLAVFKFKPDTMTQINAALNSINPVLPSIAAHSGLLGGFDGAALLADAAKLLGFGAVSSATPSVTASTMALRSATGAQSVAAEDGQSLDGKSTSVAQPDPMTLSGSGSQMVDVDDGQSPEEKRTSIAQPDPTPSGSGSQMVDAEDSQPDGTLSGSGSRMVDADDGQSLEEKRTSTAQPDSRALSRKGSQPVPPQAGDGPDTPSAPGEERDATSASTDTTDGADRAQSGPRDAKPTGGLTGAVKSVTDRIRSSISTREKRDATENTGDGTH